VTDADHASERVICEGLRAAQPAIEVVAEEEISNGYLPRSTEQMWLVDPLDGTSDFAADRDGFSVNIGLVRAGVPVLGVVMEPAKARLFGGIVGGFAFIRDGAGQRPIRVREPGAEGLRMLTSREPIDEEVLQMILRGQAIASRQLVGSALKFCLIAQGAADIYPRFGRSMEWDTAGPDAILRAAGGSVKDLQTGSSLLYGKKDFANGGFVARGA